MLYQNNKYVPNVAFQISRGALILSGMILTVAALTGFLYVGALALTKLGLMTMGPGLGNFLGVLAGAFSVTAPVGLAGVGLDYANSNRPNYKIKPFLQSLSIHAILSLTVAAGLVLLGGLTAIAKIHATNMATAAIVTAAGSASCLPLLPALLATALGVGFLGAALNGATSLAVMAFERGKSMASSAKYHYEGYREGRSTAEVERELEKSKRGAPAPAYSPDPSKQAPAPSASSHAARASAKSSPSKGGHFAESEPRAGGIPSPTGSPVVSPRAS